MVRIASHGRCNWNPCMHGAGSLYRHITLYLLLPLSLVLALALSGCQLDTAPPVQSLVFTSVERHRFLSLRTSEPGLWVIATAADSKGVFQQWPRHSVAQQLLQLDYTQVFAIVVGQGSPPNPCSQVIVDQVTRVGDSVGVHATFTSATTTPDGRMLLCGFTPTYPYELITVRKDGSWGRPIQFGLVVDGKTIVKTTQAIP